MIRVGIGGWSFAPWRGLFYPEGLPQARELGFASRAVTAIEINGTFYRTQKPESFRKWAEETPDDFVFSVKGVRYVTNRRVLAEAGPSIEAFLASGPLELKHKLGPFLWQLAPTKRFDPEDIAAFLALLPKSYEGRSLRHALEVRHESFCAPEFVALAREAGVAIVYADSDKYPAIADVTADFVYARLQRSADEIPTGYSPDDLSRWAERVRTWAGGAVPDDLPVISTERPPQNPRDVFAFMISGAKHRAPAAAAALIRMLEHDPAAASAAPRKSRARAR
jgi:uncharacterized protein YecE (DUF72 family)